jgi:hypothetical protein
LQNKKKSKIPIWEFMQKWPNYPKPSHIVVEKEDEIMKDHVLLKNKNNREKPYRIEPFAKHQARPPANRKYKILGDYSTPGAAVAAMFKDAGADPRANTPLDHAFSVMNHGVTAKQRAAFNRFHEDLYLEADYIRDSCRDMPEHVTGRIDRLMDLVCRIPHLGK